MSSAADLDTELELELNAHLGRYFTEAPSDIVLSIAEHLNTKSLLHLRLVSRDLNALISSLALRSITINLYDESTKDLLATCSQPLPGLYNNARSLTTRTGDWHLMRYVDKSRLPALYNMIERLTRLNALTMSWKEADSCGPGEEITDFVHEIQGGMAEAVFKATGGRLAVLDVQPWAARPMGFPEALLEFRGLRVLRFGLDVYGSGCNKWNRWGVLSNPASMHKCVPRVFQEGLRRLVGNNPGLEVVDVVQGCVLNHLDAGLVFVRPEDEDSSEGEEEGAGAVRSLKLMGVAFPRVLDLRRSPFSNLQHIEVLSSYSVLAFDNLWISLHASGITLRTLKAYQVSHPLVEYLASYSGLQELTIQCIEKLPACTSKESTRLFFQTALPQHSASLTKLTISLTHHVQFISGWSFNPSLWMPALESLHALKFLHLSPGIGDNFRAPPSSDHYKVFKGRYERTVTQAYQEVLDHVGCLASSSSSSGASRCELELVEIFWTGQIVGLKDSLGFLPADVRDLMRAVVKNLRSRTGVPKRLVLSEREYRLEGREAERGRKGEGEVEWGYVLKDKEYYWDDVEITGLAGKK
ncbi:hypothetical protein AX16_001147 [Volvariella volvacea WC 439]|nr:hypothetical protein AX16_001147 [Volvariella volvacea WC 439]